MNFEYPSTLGSDEIRLLRPLMPFSHLLPLRFVLDQVPRAAAPRYTAVSYMWGHQDATEWIYINQKKFSIRSNLLSCLFHLGRDRNVEWTHIWVDAICINQSNDTERNAQVRQMDQIYINAIWVSVWLGIPTLSVNPAASRLDQSALPYTEDDPFEGLEGLGEMANRMYWSRFWVVQEFLAGRRVLIYCGSRRMWSDSFRDHLCHAAGLDDLDKQLSRPGPAVNDAVALYRALPLLMDRHVLRRNMPARSLEDLLVLHHRSLCQDPRDRVFSLLGLIGAEERALLGRFFPDYSMSEERVRIIALAHILHCQRITSFSSPTKVTADSDELFLGLGIGWRGDRARLLDEAMRFRYSDKSLPILREDRLPFAIDIQLHLGIDEEP